MANTTQSSTTTTLRTADASATAAQALSEAKDIGTELMAAVSDSATALYEEQRNRAADEIAAIGDVLRRSVLSLDQSGGAVARYGDETACQINNFAERLRRRSWGELTGDIEDFARRNPVGFMGVACGLGFVAGRLLAAAAPQLMARRTTPSSSSRQNERSGDAGGPVRDTAVSAAVTSAISGGAGG